MFGRRKRQEALAEKARLEEEREILEAELAELRVRHEALTIATSPTPRIGAWLASKNGN